MYFRVASILAFLVLVAKAHAEVAVDTAAEAPIAPGGATAESMAQAILEKQQAAVEEALKAAAAKSHHSGSFVEGAEEAHSSEPDSGYQISESAGGSGETWQDLSGASDFDWSSFSEESEL